MSLELTLFRTFEFKSSVL